MSERPTSKETTFPNHEVAHLLRLSGEQYNALIEETLYAAENLETFGTPDIEHIEYSGFRIPNSSYQFGRFDVTSTNEGQKARLSLMGPHARVAYLLDNDQGVWSNQDVNTADVRLNEDILRILDTETSDPIFNTALSIRTPTNRDVFDTIAAYCSQPETKTTVVSKKLYRTMQPFSDEVQHTTDYKAGSQLLVTRTVTPSKNDDTRTETTGALLERGDTFPIGNDTVSRSYRFSYSTTGEAHADIVIRSKNKQLTELYDTTAEGAQLNAEDAIRGFNEALAVLDTTQYKLD